MPFDPQPTLVGPTLTLRPMQAADLEPLYAIASDPELWAQHPQRNRYQRPVFEALFQEGLASGGALTAINHASGAFVGSSRYYDVDTEKHALTIGYTFVARSAWGAGVNDEMKRLMLDHAFTWADRVWFYVGEANLRSRRAVEKLGAVYSHSELRNWTDTHALYALERDAWRSRSPLTP